MRWIALFVRAVAMETARPWAVCLRLGARQLQFVGDLELLIKGVQHAVQLLTALPRLLHVESKQTEDQEKRDRKYGEQTSSYGPILHGSP